MFPVETISARMLDYYTGRSDALIIDLRDRAAYEKSHIKGALHMPYRQAEEGYPFDRNKVLIFYCDRGGASMAAAKKYAKMGYKARSVIGGFGAYRGRNAT